jgi:predicted transcriptional regulator
MLETANPIARRERRKHLLVMPTGEQIRAARAMLGWSVSELARQAGVSWRTVQRAEAAGASVPRMHIATIEKLQRALEDGGIEFLQASQRSNGGGVGIRRRP